MCLKHLMNLIIIFQYQHYRKTYMILFSLRKETVHQKMMKRKMGKPIYRCVMTWSMRCVTL